MPSLSLNIPAGDGVGTSSDASSLGITKTFIVTGDFVGVVTIEAQLGTSQWCQVTSFAGNGQRQVRFAATALRVRVTNLRSGTPIVGVSAAGGNISGIELDVPAGDGVGSSVDISVLGEELWAVAGPAGITGVITIEVSSDNTNFRPALDSFTAPGCVRGVAPANFARVRRANTNVVAPGPTPVISLGGEVAEGSSAGAGSYVDSVLSSGALDIYVDSVNGDDANGGLAADDALATLAAVYRKFPTDARGPSVIRVNLADDGAGGVAVYETNYLMLNSRQREDAVSEGSYRYVGPSMVAFSPASGPASAVLDAGTPATRVDVTGAASGSGLRTQLNFTTAAPGWTVSDFALGRAFARITRGGQRVVWEVPISDNDADTLYIDHEDLVGVVQAGDTVEIVEPGAVFDTPPATFAISLIGESSANNIAFDGQFSRLGFETGLFSNHVDATFDRCRYSGGVFFFNAGAWFNRCTCLGLTFTGYCGGVFLVETTDDETAPIDVNAGKISVLCVSNTTFLSINRRESGIVGGGQASFGDRVSVRRLTNLANGAMVVVHLAGAYFNNELLLFKPGGAGSLMSAEARAFVRIPTLANCDFDGGGGNHLEMGETGTAIDIGTGVGELEEVAGYNGLFSEFPASPGDQSTGSIFTTRDYS